MTIDRLLIIADDLTGAADTGHEFARRGYGTTVTLDGGSDAQVVAVDTESRKCSASTARDAVTTAITTWPADLVYKKVDSTLRGNVATEIVTGLRAVGADIVIFAPAFPENDRVTKGERHFAAGTPVDELPFDATENPPTTSHVPSLFAETDASVVHLPLDVISESCLAVESRLTTVAEEHGTPIVVTVDATEPAHLARIATVATRMDWQILYAGSAGLARHLELPFVPSNHSDQRDSSHTRGEAALAVAGSTTPTTRDQVAAVAAPLRVQLPVEVAVRDPDRAADRASSHLAEKLSSTGGAVLTTVGPDQNVSLEQEDESVPVDLQKSRIATALALATSSVVDEADVGNLLLTGGAVAIRILDEVNAESISLTGGEIGAGIPVGRLSGGRADGTTIVTKAGGFGQPKTIRSWLSDCRCND